MAIETKDIVESLGWDKAPETREEFEQRLKKEFIPRSGAADDPDVYKIVGDKTGKRFGQIETLIRQQAKDLDIEKVEGDKIEEIIPNIFSTIKTNLDTLKSADKKTKSQRESELETDLNKYKSQYETEKQAREKANQLLEEKDKEVTTFKKNWAIEQQLGEVYKSVPFTDDYKNDPIRQKGFKQFLNEEVVFDLDDKGTLIALNKEGKPFTNPAGNNFKSPQEILAEYADKAKVKANNNLNAQRQQQNTQPVNGQGGNVAVHNYKKRS